MYGVSGGHERQEKGRQREGRGKIIGGGRGRRGGGGRGETGKERKREEEG